MKAKLIKDSDGYWLDISDDGITKRPLTDFGQLSIKNCEAIERGYDLFELAEKEAKKIHDWNKHKYSEVFYNKLVRKDAEFIKIGFKKALEILGDKKFSVKDMEKLMFATIEFTEQKEGETYPFLKSFIQSLQPKEWDVEIEMENKQQLTNGYKNQPDNVIGFITAYENVVVPKLDSDGCLILRRI